MRERVSGRAWSSLWDTQGVISVLELTDYEVYYGNFRAVRGLGLSLFEGEALGLAGRNGAGKTSVLKGVLGLVKVRGRVLYRGRNLRKIPPYKRADLGIGYFPQETQLFRGLTVEENLKLVEDKAGSSEIRDKVFGYFPGLEGHYGQNAGDLSGGEKAMVSMARLLLTEPELLLLDEPTEGLMPEVSEKILELLQNMIGEGKLVLIAEQKIDFLESISSEIYYLERGRLKEVMTP